ncbi:unnamed protein product [Parnassius mnemosyne]|uniref:Odorant receptor n=1 Tax=Parnassius mnemosyne TaxID=213953 RepID=A0AAV1KK78_9NEOP
MKYLSNFHPEFVQPLLVGFKMLDKFNLTFFDDNVSFLKRYWKFLYLVPFTVAYITCMSIYMINIFSEEIDVTEFAYMVPVYISFVTAVVKIIIILLKRKDISTLVNDLGKSWRTFNLNSKQIERKEQLMKKLNLFLKIFYYVNVGAASLHLITPLVSVLVRKFVLKQDCKMVLPFQSVYPFDTSEDWVKYLVTYAFQTFIAFRLIYVYLASQYLMINLCAFLAINFALLSEDLINVTPYFNKVKLLSQYSFHEQLERESTNITIQEFVKRHQKLIRLSHQLDDIFNRIVFVILLLVTIVVCFFGFAITISHGVIEKLNDFISVLGLLFPTYILCYYSELLTSESLRIADAAYENLWLDGNVSYQKTILMIIRRSQKPCCLTSIKYVPINLNTFTKVLSTTWSYFSLATSMYSEKE